MSKKTFNRTSMESKLVVKRAPTSKRTSTFNRTSMESKPCPTKPLAHGEASFNRTSMESKLMYPTADVVVDNLF